MFPDMRGFRRMSLICGSSPRSVLVVSLVGRPPPRTLCMTRTGTGDSRTGRRVTRRETVLNRRVMTAVHGLVVLRLLIHSDLRPLNRK